MNLSQEEFENIKNEILYHLSLLEEMSKDELQNLAGRIIELYRFCLERGMEPLPEEVMSRIKRISDEGI